MPLCEYFLLVENALASTLNSCMSAATNIAPDVASFHSTEPSRKMKVPWSYPGVVKYLSKKFVDDLTVAEKDSTILR